jgi:putative membrane protein
MMWWNGGGTGVFFGPLFMFLILAATVVLIVLLIRWLGGPLTGVPSSSLVPRLTTPLDILKERYAKGEINKTEFEERRKVLGV